MHEFQSPLEAFIYWEAKTPNANFLIQPINGKRKIYTYQSAGLEIRKIASALQSYKLPLRSQVAILSKNCAHWVMSDLAIMMVGHVTVPIYPTLNAKTIENIIDPSIIGGFILRVGDKQFDASISGEMNDLRRKFDDNLYVPKL